MTERNNDSPNDQPDIEELHKKVDALLDTPVAKESEAWPLPIEGAHADTGQGYEPQAPAAH